MSRLVLAAAAAAPDLTGMAEAERLELRRLEALAPEERQQLELERIRNKHMGEAAAAVRLLEWDSGTVVAVAVVEALPPPEALVLPITKEVLAVVEAEEAPTLAEQEGSAELEYPLRLEAEELEVVVEPVQSRVVMERRVP